MKLQTRKLPLADVLALAAGLLVIVVMLAANSAAGEDSAAGVAVYKSKCATCHGPDGGGTAVGKSLKVADLRSAEVQSRSDAELTQVISDGKDNMPGFKGYDHRRRNPCCPGPCSDLRGKRRFRSKKK